MTSFGGKVWSRLVGTTATWRSHHVGEPTRDVNEGGREGRNPAIDSARWNTSSMLQAANLSATKEYVKTPIGLIRHCLIAHILILVVLDALEHD